MKDVPNYIIYFPWTVCRLQAASIPPDVPSQVDIQDFLACLTPCLGSITTFSIIKWYFINNFVITGNH